MRVAPIGLAGGGPVRPRLPGGGAHPRPPQRLLAAGAFALMISELVRGADLRGAVASAIEPASRPMVARKWPQRWRAVALRSWAR